MPVFFSAPDRKKGCINILMHKVNIEHFLEKICNIQYFLYYTKEEKKLKLYNLKTESLHCPLRVDSRSGTREIEEWAKKQ